VRHLGWLGRPVMGLCPLLPAVCASAEDQDGLNRWWSYSNPGISRGNYPRWKWEPRIRSGKHPNRIRSCSRPFSRFPVFPAGTVHGQFRWQTVPVGTGFSRPVFNPTGVLVFFCYDWWVDHATASAYVGLIVVTWVASRLWELITFESCLSYFKLGVFCSLWYGWALWLYGSSWIMYEELSCSEKVVYTRRCNFSAL